MTTDPQPNATRATRVRAMTALGVSEVAVGLACLVWAVVAFARDESSMGTVGLVWGSGLEVLTLVAPGLLLLLGGPRAWGLQRLPAFAAAALAWAIVFGSLFRRAG
jgi:hypothetical protein